MPSQQLVPLILFVLLVATALFAWLQGWHYEQKIDELTGRIKSLEGRLGTFKERS